MLKLIPTFRHFVFAVVVCALASGGASLRAETPAANPYAPLEFLVGGTWVAPLPVDKSGAKRALEARFTWTQNHHGVQFESAWTTGDKRAPYTSGMYAWDAAKGKIVIFYTDSGGSLVEGPVTLEGNVLAHELSSTDNSGKVEPVRVRLTKLSPDVFTNEIFLLKDSTWSKFVEVRYERQR